MALIVCKKCGQQMSDKAQVCPHCGAIVKKSSSVVLPLILGILVYGVLPFILVLIGFLLDVLHFYSLERIWLWIFKSYPLSCAISAAAVSMFIARSKQDRLICLIVPFAIYGILTGLIELFDHYIFFYEYRFFIGILEVLSGLGVVIFAAVRRRKHNKVS